MRAGALGAVVQVTPDTVAAPQSFTQFTLPWRRP